MTAKSLESGHTGEPCLMADIPPPKRQRGIARIPLDKVPTILHGVPGLIIGPAFSHYPGVIRECADAIASKFGVATSGNLFATVELAHDTGANDNDIKSAISGHITKVQPSPQLSLLAKTPWKAVLSFTLDDNFERKMQQEADRRPARPLLTVLNDLGQTPVPRTFPVYKMLGSAAREDFAFSTATYLKRKKQWRHAIKGFIDRVKGSPVLCLGMADQQSALLDLLADFSEPSSSPPSVIFLVDDPIADNREISDLLQPRTRHLVVSATAGELLREIEKAHESAYTTLLPFEQKGTKPFDDLLPFADYVTPVNQQLEPIYAREEKHSLHDLLFSPSIARWDPYAHNLDFSRTINVPLKKAVAKALGELTTPLSVVLLTGTSASGKTTVLKRLAYDLAKNGDLALWLSPWLFSDAQVAFQDVFRVTAKLKDFAGRRIVIVMDDPISFGTTAVRDVVSAARARNIEATFVIGVRTTDWVTLDDRESLVGSLPVADEITMPESLDPSELVALPAYLKLLEIATSDDDANAQVRGVRSNRSQDTLSLLYYLLPATRASISGSVRDEYLRLGDMSGLSKVLLGTVKQTTDLLKEGYDMVAVADYYRAPLPIEVLVSALGVDYSDWLEAASPNGAAWGILYSDYSREGDTTTYRPRNSIITNLLVEMINGGSTQRSGEVAVLSKLIRACTGTQPVYERFCAQILVQNDQTSKLDFADGLRLFDDALAALPMPDKALLHHKGIWVKKKGNDPIAASRIFEQALATPNYPHATRLERNEMIHTSIAAAAVQSVVQKKLDFRRGAAAALEHLNKARASGYFSAHAIHVQANLMAELADQVGPGPNVDTYHLVNRALADVDRGLLLLRTPFAKKKHIDEEVAMLESVRDKVIMRIGTVQTLKEDAEVMWTQNRSQEGFALVSRKIFMVASASNKGSDYKDAFEYCQQTMDRVRAETSEPIRSLFEVALHIYYKWQITSGHQNFYDEIDWNMVRDYTAVILRQPEGRNDPLYKYLHALALAHLNRWADANLLFLQLRQSGLPHEVLYAPRDLLLEPKGGYRRVQGTVKQAADRPHLHVEELHQDFQIERRGKWAKDGGIVHAFVQFAFAGPVATEHA